MSRPAERFWNALWNDDENRDFWTRVAPEIAELIQSLSPDRQPAVLDLGCGLGRNAVAFASAGFAVTATDLSTAAITHLAQWSRRLDLKMRIAVCEFTDDVFRPESFDVVISVNVLYHGYREQLVRGMQNVRKWLKPGGLFYFTCPSREDGDYGRGTELAPHTFEMEPGHRHYCADESDLDDLIADFKLLARKRRDHEWDDGGVTRFSSRWQMLVRKPR